MTIAQTKEDQAINRQVAKRLGWNGVTFKSLTAVEQRNEAALTMTGARVGFASAARTLCVPAGSRG